jgi:pimeloyl-ACP methyl ester carboxylesterase
MDMAAVDFTVLDNPEASARSFYPRSHWTKTPEGAVDYAIDVEEDIVLSSRFFPVGLANPTILFFYGNGETAAGYDVIAPFYNDIGVNFFVADYRGYGAAGGSPAFTKMLSDSHKVLESLRETMEVRQFTGPLYVMGRSMGRHSAFELAVNASEQINGVIIESGRPTIGNFTQGLVPDVADALEAAYVAKVHSIDVPALVIHGQMDEGAPLRDAVAMHNDLKTTAKHLEIIPRAGHNDLMYVGLNQYFRAIREFMVRYAGRRTPPEPPNTGD